MSPPSTGVAPASRWSALQSWLVSPVHGASLACFRFCVGIVMALEAYTLCVPSASTFGRVPLTTFYTGAEIKFRAPYAAFEWLPMLPPLWIHIIVGLLAVGGVCLALGLFHRVAATTVFLSWGYLYAVECTRTYWMSYYYLELLVCFLLIWMPASRCYSIDAWLSRGRGLDRTVPRWTLVLLRAQLVITYFYAGVAKVGRDWLIDGEPVRYFLSKARVISEWAPYLTPAQMQTVTRVLHSEFLTYFISWVGAGFDLAVGFLLLFRRTRIFGMVLMFIFHGTNHFIIFSDIHWFPLVGITTALIFLDPDWPERFWAWLKRPTVTKPDWGYLVGGGILFPVVGAALGWSLPPTPPAAPPSLPPRRGRFAVLFVIVWIAWQGLSPLRQYVTSADSRFTWEGLSFCWRLKAEVYRCVPGKLFIGDPKILSRDSTGRTQIDWTEWKGEREIYRTVVPRKLDWSRLPEVLVIREPRLGERVIYNPYSGQGEPRGERESAQRIAQIWRERYGRVPQGIHRTLPPAQVAQAYITALKNRGTPVKDQGEASAAFEKLIRDDRPTELDFLLGRINPFGLEGAAPLSQPALLLIDDPEIFESAGTNTPVHLRVSRAAWKPGPDTQGPEAARVISLGGEPLLVFCTEALLEEERDLPGAFVVGTQDNPERPPQIRWNHNRELTLETVMHVSMQPFLLRRYARHVAEVWEKQYGRQPTVRVTTAVSLNGRPAQMLVDPEADLAHVSSALFGHNPWIRDLGPSKIPPGGIKQ